MNLFEDLLIVRFGSKEKAKLIVEGLAPTGVFGDDAFRELLRLSYLDSFIYLIKPIAEAKGLIELMRAASQFKARTQDVLRNMPDDEKEAYKRYMGFISKDNAVLDYLPKRRTRLTIRMLMSLIGDSHITSKEKLATELTIDKKTLNKWLHHFYGRKFDAKRKITFKEYIDIMLKFSLKDSENREWISENLANYSSRLDNDLVHNRRSLLDDEELQGLNYKSLKENLVLQGLDTGLKRIPFSVKEMIIQKLS